MVSHTEDQPDTAVSPEQLHVLAHLDWSTTPESKAVYCRCFYTFYLGPTWWTGSRGHGGSTLGSSVLSWRGRSWSNQDWGAYNQPVCHSTAPIAMYHYECTKYQQFSACGEVTPLQFQAKYCEPVTYISSGMHTGSNPYGISAKGCSPQRSG